MGAQSPEQNSAPLASIPTLLDLIKRRDVCRAQSIALLYEIDSNHNHCSWSLHIVLYMVSVLYAVRRIWLLKAHNEKIFSQVVTKSFDSPQWHGTLLTRDGTLVEGPLVGRTVFLAEI
jgi:hypothetical protein